MAPPLRFFIKSIFILVLITTDCFAGAPERLIRVAVIQDTALVVVCVNGYYKIVDSNSNKVIARGKNLSTVVKLDGNKVSIPGIDCNGVKLLIEAEDPESIVIDGRKYRGNIQFIKKDNARMLVINHIGLEDYVKGILYHEVSHYWPQEALKAQAVVCRTYAVYQKSQNASRDYDVTNDTYSQVYGGKSSERYRTNKAVDETAGQVLIYMDKIFPAYFHATCAGHTEDARLLWDINVLPLKGVPCSYCKKSVHFSWVNELALTQIKEAMLKSGNKECGDILSISVNDRDVSGRIKDLTIKTPQGNLKFSAKDFRGMLGANIIKSTNFSVRIEGKNAIFEGLGWGHGVGMCQWGAYFMAKEGYIYKQILQYYYPGSEIKDHL